MTSKTHRRKRRILAKAIALGFAVAAIGAPAALADGRSPDTRDAASQAQGSVLDGRSPDTIDAASAAQNSILDGRSPDTRDAAYRAHEPVVVVQSSSFDWGDAGIGFGVGFGLMLVGLGAGLGLRRHSKPEMRVGHVTA